MSKYKKGDIVVFVDDTFPKWLNLRFKVKRLGGDGIYVLQPLQRCPSGVDRKGEIYLYETQISIEHKRTIEEQIKILETRHKEYLKTKYV